jgi:type IV secretion system protein VirD4
VFHLKQLARKQKDMHAAWLGSLGRDHAQRVNSINAMFEDRRATITVMALFSLDMKGRILYSDTSLIGSAHVSFVVSRNLAGMDNRDREYLRIMELLNSAAGGANTWYQAQRIALLSGDGKGIRSELQWVGSSRFDGNFEKAISLAYASVDQTVNGIQQHIADMDQSPNLPPAYRSIVEEAKGLISPSGGGAWLKPAEVPRTVFAPSGPLPSWRASLSMMPPAMRRSTSTPKR